MSTNLYKTFKDVKSPDEIGKILLPRDRYLSKSYDEPTYYAFKLQFSSPLEYNDTGNKINFDKMPHPLFLDVIDEKTVNNFGYGNIPVRYYYSTTQFLRDNNEFIREDMLRTFINMWSELETNFQWYFQKVSGLNTIMKINPLTGKRVNKDARLVISTLEGLDQRVTHLLNLYRKIAWDDTYQRWILPDMMRFFKLRLYVSEFRTFHRSEFAYRKDAKSNINISSALTGIPPVKYVENTNDPFILRLLYNYVPTYIIDFDRCEFDIESFNVLPDIIDVANAEMRQLEFSLKVGNFTETYINPMLDFLWKDSVLNSYARSKEENVYNNATGVIKSSQRYLLTTEVNNAQDNLVIDSQHESGTPFNELANSKILFGAKGPGADGKWGTNDDDSVTINPTNPNTWLGNAFTAGKSIVKNLIKDKINSAKVNKIPGLGISYTEALAAIQSKNVFTILAIGRKAISDTVSGTLPSQELEENLVDTQFKLFLEGISESQATDPTSIEYSSILDLKEAASLTLSNNGTWERIRDLSKATDLVSKALNEININNNIVNPNALKQNYNQQNIRTVPVQHGIVYEGIPSSQATNNTVTINNNITIPVSSVQLNGTPTDGLNTTDLGSTDGNLNRGNTIKSSLLLGTDAGARLNSVNSILGTDAGEKLYNIKSSIFLEGTIKDTFNSEAETTSLIASEKIFMPPASSQLTNIKLKNYMVKSNYEARLEGKKLDIPDPGEAVDGDTILPKNINISNISQATNNKLK